MQHGLSGFSKFEFPIQVKRKKKKKKRNKRLIMGKNQSLKIIKYFFLHADLTHILRSSKNFTISPLNIVSLMFWEMF